MPPLQRVLGEQWLVNPPDSLSSRLASWQDPTYLAPLGHAVIPDGPSGAIEPAPAPPAAEPRRIDLQRKATRSDAPVPGTPLGTAAGPASLQRAADVEPLDTGPALAAPAAAEHRPLISDDPPHAEFPESTATSPHDTGAATGLRPESPSLGPMASLQRSPDSAPAPRSGQSLNAAPGPGTSVPVQPVATPFAVQRALISGHSPLGQPARPQADPVAPVASLLASTDPPERRELPVVAAPRPPSPPLPTPPAAVQRAAEPTGEAPLLGDTEIIASDSDSTNSAADVSEGAETPLPMPPQQVPQQDTPRPLVTAQRSAAPDPDDPFAASDGETAPLLGATGLAAPIVQTMRDEDSPAEPQAPMPIAPLIADQPRPGPTAEGQVRLGLGSPVSGPLAGPAPFVQRSGGTRPGPDASTPSGLASLKRTSAPGPGQLGASLQRIDSPPAAPGLGLPSTALGTGTPTAVQRVASPARPLPPPVMVMRSLTPAETAPVASRSIADHEPLYEPDPGPEAPLLGSRPFEAARTAAGVDPASSTAAAPEPRASEPGSAVQRSTWSHMPASVQQAEFPLPESGSPVAHASPAPPIAGAPPAVQRFAGPAADLSAPLPDPAEPLPVAAAPVALQAMEGPSAPQTVPLQAVSEVAPQPVEAVVQRVAAPSVAVQSADAAPSAAPAAGAAPAADPAALLAVLYEPLVRRLRADLRVDRERRGRLTDL
ncbi:hypothetical protein [Glycomyces sp. NPDC048151]|uniref:hypothetical protein n=1 Tax=Glycomyces sp. NPDC048151 TaxID=3364002 RepID=UPI00371F0328